VTLLKHKSIVTSAEDKLNMRKVTFIHRGVNTTKKHRNLNMTVSK